MQIHIVDKFNVLYSVIKGIYKYIKEEYGKP